MVSLTDLLTKESGLTYEKILLADKCQKEQKTLQQLLKKNLENVEVQCFGSANELIDTFYKEGSNLIVTSLNLSASNGIQVVHQVRRFDKKIPIILFYGDNQEDLEFSESEVYSCGATLVIPKTKFKSAIGPFI